MIAVVPVAEVTDTLVSGVVAPTAPVNVTVPVPLPTLSENAPSTVVLNVTLLLVVVTVVFVPSVTAVP